MKHFHGFIAIGGYIVEATTGARRAAGECLGERAVSVPGDWVAHPAQTRTRRTANPAALSQSMED